MSSNGSVVQIIPAIVINNSLLYCVMVCSVYLCAICNMINRKITYSEKINNDITTFNSRLRQIDRDLYLLKNKSSDLFDTTVVLKKHSDELQTEVNVLKHRQYCYDKDMLQLNNEIKFIKKL